MSRIASMVDKLRVVHPTNDRHRALDVHTVGWMMLFSSTIWYSGSPGYLLIVPTLCVNASRAAFPFGSVGAIYRFGRFRRMGGAARYP